MMSPTNKKGKTSSKSRNGNKRWVIIKVENLRAREMEKRKSKEKWRDKIRIQMVRWWVWNNDV